MVIRFVLITALLSLLLPPSVQATDAADECLPANARRTFMQLFFKDAQLSQDAVERRFAALENAGFEEVILQWSSYDHLSLYPFSRAGGQVEMVLPKIIDAARNHHIRIWMGTHYDNGFWEIAEGSPRQARQWFSRQLELLKRRLPVLIDTVRHSDPEQQVVIGWYISDEIDDQSWGSKYKRRELQEYLHQVVDLLRNGMPGWPVAISGFSSAAMTPAELAAFWSETLAATGIDTLLFQDGIGVGNLTQEQFSRYASRLAVLNSGRPGSFSVVVELFEKVGDGKDGSMKLRTAAAERVLRQLAETMVFAADGITLFSAPDYMLDDGDRRARRLLKMWQRAAHNCGKVE
ncbi:MAG TPA: DUF4434 domain-containing protein [Gammaproteobacteria bacterium]|nr:DUF4434 domain-containing protein [Gammaproteobacteria bacterium]